MRGVIGLRHRRLHHCRLHHRRLNHRRLHRGRNAFLAFASFSLPLVQCPLGNFLVLEVRVMIIVVEEIFVACIHEP